jgi:hypothetical protein
MFEELFELTIDGAFASKDEFNEFTKEASNEEIFSVLKEGAFSDFNEFNSLYSLKKKEESQGTSQEDVTESITKDETTPTSLESSESKYDDNWLTDFIGLDENEAKSKLDKEFKDSLFDVNTSGFAMGNAITVTNKLDPTDTVEIDLRPLFGGDEEEKLKLKDLLNRRVSDNKTEKIAVTANTETFSENPIESLELIKRNYPEIDVNYSTSINEIDDTEAITVNLKKGDKEESFTFQPGNKGAVSKVSKFLYENMDEPTQKYWDDFKETSKNSTKVEISEDSIKQQVYNQSYFKDLISYIESGKEGIVIDDEIKSEIQSGSKKELKYASGMYGQMPVQDAVPYTQEEILSLRDKYLSEYSDIIDQFDKERVRKSEAALIDRSKRLKTETSLINSPTLELDKARARKAYDLEVEDYDTALEEKVTAELQMKDVLTDFAEKSKAKLQSLDSGFELKQINGEVVFVSNNAIPTQNDADKLKEINKEFKLATKETRLLIDKKTADLRRELSDVNDVKVLYDSGVKNYDKSFASSQEIKNTLGSFFLSIYTGSQEVKADILDGVFGKGAGMYDRALANLAREDKQEITDYMEKFAPTKMTYDEALKYNRGGEFIIRELSAQMPYMAIAMASGGAGSAIGVSGEALAATSFGVSAFGSKMDENVNMKRIADKAKKDLNELETIKKQLDPSTYREMKYNLDREIKSNDISMTEKYLSSTFAGITEGGVTYFLGTVPNSAKIIKDLKPSKVIDDIFKSNYKAAGDLFVELGKRTSGEVAEETLIEGLNVINDALILDKEVDFSMLDDVALSAILMSGSSNSPSLAYSTITSQVTASKYKTQVNQLTSEINGLKSILLSEDIPASSNSIIHDQINDKIKQIADYAASSEADMMLMGSSNVKEILSLGLIRNGILDRAGVKSDDTQEMADIKVKSYLATLDESESKAVRDKLNYVSNRRNEIISGLDYTTAIDNIFGDKGNKIAEGLDDKLTPQQKYVEVYKQIREEVKTNAKKEYDAIQEQEARDIPDAQPAEGVQEMETEVREPAVEETQEVIITPETSSNYANMTEDGEGNFVFYHVGQEGYNTIEPRVGDTKATSAAERSALSKVGGLAMYYTAPETGEGAVTGKAKYQVKVPVEKVYDFNNDPLNFNEEGKKRHSEENPGKAYDANTSLAYVTKIAGENGFDMVVADWNGKTRAQTTKALAPVDLEMKDGNTITKKFDNEYESNAKKGFESVVPESKQSKFDDLYNEIYKERNKENKYDDLYFLSEKKRDYTQEQITELINNSDVSQEIKDKYNSILESKEEARRSKKKRIQNDYASKEVDRVKALPTESQDGATMNLDGSKYEDGGLVIPVASVNMKASELTTEAIEKFIEQNSESIGADNVKVGIYKFPNSDQVSIDINIVADKSMRAEALKIGKELGQESLFDLDTFENIKTGADGKNPKKLSPKEFLEIQKRLSKTKTKDTLGNELESFANRVVEDGIESLSDDALQFYADNKEALDKIIQEKQKQKPKTESKARSLALKIVEGKQDFSDSEIELFAANEEKIRSEVDSIANTRGVQITSDNYKDIIKSTKRPRKKVSTDEYAALKDQIRLEARAARDAQKDLNLKRKEISEMIKNLANIGKITSNQSKVLINRISSVNLNNEQSVDKLIKYMDKVYKNAEYADNILRSNKNRNKAKKNIKSKIGSAKVVFNTLNKLFSIDAKLIPQDVLDVYNDIVTQFGSSKAVLNLDDISVINEKANSILDAIDKEVSEIPKLQLLFEGLNKVIVKGKEDFSSTIAQALSNKEITQEDFDLMKKYKKDIVSPAEKTKSVTEPVTFEFKENNVEDSMENKGASRLIELLKNKKAVDQLSDGIKKNIQSVIDNIDAGFFPSYANNIANEIESIIAKDKVIPRIKKGKYIIDRVTSRIKNFFLSNKSTTEYQIRQNPLSDIDNILGNMNRTDIYDNIFGKAAKSYANLDSQIDIVHENILKADALLFKQFNNNGNKVTESKYRIMAYMLEREFQSNRDNNKVFSAKDAIKAAIDSQRKGETTIYSKRDVKILESILKEFDGEVNIDNVFNKFSKREKKAISIIDEVNKSIADKALYTASVIRGNRPNMIDNYVHHSVASSNENSIESITSKYNQFKTFSTKAGTLVERTPGVKALDFDVLKSTIKGAKETLTDYHMTDTARVIFKTLNKIKADIISNKKSTERQIETANALANAFDTAMRQVFEMNYVNNGMNMLSKAKGLGYKALLASVPRAAAEMGSNFAYVMSTSPKSFYAGTKYRKYLLDQRGRDVMMILNSEQTGKLYSKKVTGKTADIGLFADSEGANPTGAVNSVQNKANQILSYLSKVTTKPTEKIAEVLISTPDKAISRPLWFGSLDTKFKEITGKNIDIEAIRNEDSKYLNDNKEALDEATKFADKEITRAATSINVFNGILKNKIDPNDSASLKIAKEINGFMTNFIIYEYTTSRSAISAIINSGEISRQKGASLLLATTIRMSLYMVLYQSFSHIFDSAVAALTGADIGDEELPEEDLLSRQLVGSIVSMILGKNLGNFAKIIPNIAIETINEKYLEDLRKGEDYDPYKHSISFSMISKEDLKKMETGRTGIGDILLKSLSGPYSPIVKTLSRAAILGAKITSEKSKDSTKQKAAEELTTRIVIEMMGNMGMIPFYKDVRRVLIKDLFSENKDEESPSINLRKKTIIKRKNTMILKK